MTIIRRAPIAAEAAGAGPPTVAAGAAAHAAAPALQTRNGGHRRGPRPGHCLTCGDPNRAQVELLLANGASYQAVAKKFPDLGYHAIRRHWQNHVSAATRTMLTAGPVKLAALSSRLADEGLSALDHLRIARASLYAMLDAAVSAGDRSGTALIAGRIHENVLACARISGEWMQSPLIVNQQNVLVLPQVTALQAALIRVLAKYPDARVAVIGEFKRLEAAQAPVDDNEISSAVA